MEEAKEVQRRKEIGFCIGSEWSKVSEEEATEILKSGTTTTLACELGTAWYMCIIGWLAYYLSS